MINQARSFSRIRVVPAAIGLVLLVGIAPRAEAASCGAVGSFVFTIAEGAGFLRLSADGRAEMDLVPGHSTCCSPPGRVLNGTYRTSAAGAQCVFIIDLVDPFDGPINIVGVTAFQGSVLMFQAATVPSFGAGLALRSDTLTGQ